MTILLEVGSQRASGIVMEAPPLRVPDVIVISDDEESEGESNCTAMQPFSWTEVADKLLMVAKNRELRDDLHVANLLHNLGIPPSHDVRRSLQAVCEKLGELLMSLRGRNRKYRTCEGQVMVVCEVLSLSLAIPSVLRMTEQQTQSEIKEEVVDMTTNGLYQLMDRWSTYIMQFACSTDCRVRAVDLTMARLETLYEKCTREIELLQKSMAECKEEMKRSAEEFVDSLHHCQLQVEENLGMGEQAFRLYDETFNTTGAVQDKFHDNSDRWNSLVRRTREIALSREFYDALLKLTCTVAQVTQHLAGQQDQQNQQITSEQHVNMLGSKMLMEIDCFSAGLQAVLERSAQCDKDQIGSADTAWKMANELEHRPELLHFAKVLEGFWLIYRNWLPSVVLDKAVRMFDAVLRSNARAGCPITNTISRICASLQENDTSQ